MKMGNLFRFQDAKNYHETRTISKLKGGAASVYVPNTSVAVATISPAVVRGIRLVAAVVSENMEYATESHIVSAAIGAARSKSSSINSAARYFVGEFHMDNGRVILVCLDYTTKTLMFCWADENDNMNFNALSASNNLTIAEVPPVECIWASLWKGLLCETNDELRTVADKLNPALIAEATGNVSGILSDADIEDLYSIASSNLYYRTLAGGTASVPAGHPDSLSYLLDTERVGNDEMYHSLDHEQWDDIAVYSTIAGTFTFFNVDKRTGTRKPVASLQNDNERMKWFADRYGKYALDPKRELTEEEESTITRFDKHDFVPIPRIAQTAAIIHASPSIRDLEFTGPAGSGKSMAAKMLAYMLKIPYRVFTCSPGLDESDLFGRLWPATEDPSVARKMNAEQYAKCEDLKNGHLSLYRIAREILKLPSMQMLKDEPRLAYEIMTHHPLKDSDPMPLSARDLMLMYFQLAAEERDRMVAELRDKGGKSLVYIKSSIVQALENGDLVEIQEQNALSPGVLLGFNDLRDRNSSGYKLPNGEMLIRNPNTVIVMTSNVEYEGCRPMNSSVVSRSDMCLDFAALSSESMARRAQSVTKYPNLSELTEMAEFIQELRNAMKNEAIDDASDLGVRELINWALATMALGGDAYSACIDTVINKASYLTENREHLMVLLNNNKFFNTYNQANMEGF